jgi:MoxR-like ATPase
MATCLVLATQNPIELEGTFPLPEAALDRFFIRISLGYPSPEGEKRLLRTWTAPIWRMRATANTQATPALLDANGIFALRQMVTQIYFSEDAEDYLLALVHATRNHPDILLGLSPRAGLAVKVAAQAWAAFSNHDHVRPDDIQQVLVPVGAHRLVLHPEAELRHRDAAKVLEDIMAETPVAGSWAGLAVGVATEGRF